jgi:DNA processing protein
MDKYFNGFNLIKCLSFSSLCKIYKKIPDIKYLWDITNPDEYVKMGLDPEKAENLIFEKKKINPDFEYEKIFTKGIKTISILNPNYPVLLKNIYDPPFILYFKGDIKILNTTINIGVVGTRKYSLYGEYITKKFVKDLVLANFCIVSGLARGIDTIAHNETLINNGKTAGVLGSSLEDIYPRCNRKLAYEIEKMGCLLSEFPIGTPPNAYNFPRRNRIISGLSKGTLVTEAPEKSGALITADFALHQNRDIFAVPGDINRPNSKGANLLIQRGEAKLVLEASDIFDSFQLNIGMFLKQEICLSKEEEKIVNILQKGVSDINQLLIESPLEISETLKTVSMLEIRGIIKQHNGKIVLIL